MTFKHDFPLVPAAAVRLVLRWRIAPDSGRPVAGWTATPAPAAVRAGQPPGPPGLDELLRRHRELRAA